METMSHRGVVARRAQQVAWSGIRRMFERALADPTLVNLSVGEPDFPTPPHIVNAAKKALDDGYTRYSPGLGYAVLREAIAAKMARMNGFEVDPMREVIATAGAMEGLLLALLATIDVGDEVIIPDPGYTNYEGQILLAGGVPVPVRLSAEHGFSMAPDDVRAAMSPRTRVILLNTPANPTGGTIRRAHLDGLAELARDRDLVVIADEVYEAIVYDNARNVSIAALPGMRDRTLTVMSCSKTYVMTGWRVGYVVAGAQLTAEMQKLQENVVSCVNSAAQIGAVAALSGPQDCVREMVADYDRRRKFLVSALNEIPGIRCATPGGAFYAFPDIRSFGRPAEEFANWLVDHAGVVTVPGTAFGKGGEGHLRLCYAVSMQQLERAVDGIRRAVQTL
jgi:aspartate/methionine/tyrosine aminotransferase